MLGCITTGRIGGQLRLGARARLGRLLVFKAGDRIRLTIGTANTPGTVTPAPDLLDEAGGQLRVLRGPTYDSYVQLQVIPAR